MMCWENSQLGYWLNLVLAGITDIGFIISCTGLSTTEARYHWPSTLDISYPIQHTWHFIYHFIKNQNGN